MTAPTDPAAPVEVTDRLVAFVYGAGAHPSLLAGMHAAADLVARQPGPWTLTDPVLAAQASEIADRLADVDARAVSVAVDVIDSLDRARRGLFTLFTEHHAELPIHLRHHVEQLEGRLAGFVAEYGPALRSISTINDPDAVPGPADVPAPPVVDEVPFPTIEGAMGFSSAEWTSLIRDRGLSVPDVKAELGRRMTAAGRIPPATLTAMKGQRNTCGLMLRVISDLYVAAQHPEEAGA